jgi:hypothetical protein
VEQQNDIDFLVKGGLKMNEPDPSVGAFAFADGPPFDVEGFLGVLRTSIPAHRDEAKAYLRAMLDDLEQPSQRIREYVESGEWDCTTFVVLHKLTASEISRLCCAAIGARGGDGGVRFCGNAALEKDGCCAIGAHNLDSRVTGLGPGYYLIPLTTSRVSLREGIGPRLGIYSTPVLSLGGLIDEAVENAFFDLVTPFSLTLGQFKFVIASIEEYRRRAEVARGVRALPLGQVEVTEQQRTTDSLGPSDYDALTDLRTRMEAVEGMSTKPPPQPPVEAGPRVDDPRSFRTDPSFVELQEVVDSLSQDRQEVMDHVSSLSHQTLDLHSKALESEYRMRELTARIDQVQEQARSSQKSCGEALEIAERAVMAAEANRFAAPVPGQRVNDLTVPLTKVKERLSRLEVEMLEPTGRLQRLADATLELEQKIDFGGVKYGEYQFRSTTAFVRWVEGNSPRDQLDYGLFLDAFSLLHALHTGTVTMAKALQTERAIQNVKYHSRLEAKVSTSYDTTYPDIFGSGDGQETFGMAIPTHEKWFNPATQLGLSKTITTNAASTQTSVKAAIMLQLGPGPLRELAKTMLEDSREFIYQLVKFVNDFYAEMSEAQSMTSAEAWLLTRTLLQEVLMKIRETRNEVELSREEQPLLHIWGALKAHVVMARFNANGIRNDPALTGALVRFILKRKTDVDGMESVSNKIRTLENKVRQAETELRRKADK